MKSLEPPSSLSERIEGLRITRDDVDFLIELFRRDVAPPKLSDDHFEFDSLDEFIASKGYAPTKLEIESTTTDGPHRRISAKFEGDSVWLYGSRETPFHEAKEFLRTKRPWTYGALNPWPWLFGAMVLSSVFVTLAGQAEKKHEPISEWPLYFLGAALVMAVIGFLYRRFDFGLRLTRRHEGGFWKRNAEKIGLMLVGGVVGALMTWLSKVI